MGNKFETVIVALQNSSCLLGIVQRELLEARRISKSKNPARQIITGGHLVRYNDSKHNKSNKTKQQNDSRCNVHVLTSFCAGWKIQIENIMLPLATETTVSGMNQIRKKSQEKASRFGVECFSQLSTLGWSGSDYRNGSYQLAALPFQLLAVAITYN